MVRGDTVEKSKPRIREASGLRRPGAVSQAIVAQAIRVSRPTAVNVGRAVGGNEEAVTLSRIVPFDCHGNAHSRYRAVKMNMSYRVAFPRERGEQYSSYVLDDNTPDLQVARHSVHAEGGQRREAVSRYF